MPLVTRLALPVPDKATLEPSSSSDQSDCVEVPDSEFWSDIADSPIPAGKARRKPARKAPLLSSSSEDEGEVDDGVAGTSKHSRAVYQRMAAQFIEGELRWPWRSSLATIPSPFATVPSRLATVPSPLATVPSRLARLFPRDGPLALREGSFIASHFAKDPSRRSLCCDA